MLALGMLLVAALPVLAQGETHSVAFNGMGFQFPNALATSVNISQRPGDPVDLGVPGGPQAPYTEFVLYNEMPAPESIFEGGGIRLYRVADLANYPEYQRQADVLSGLIGGQADLSPYMIANNSDGTNKLSFLPVVPAGQVIRARARYVGNESFRGIAYLTTFRQDVSPFVGTEFLYTVQGVSTDGNYYVSAIFPVTTALFPDSVPGDLDYDAFVATLDQYTNDSITTLNAAAPADFTPTLDMLDAVVSSLVLTPVTTAGPLTPDQPTATIEPTTVADPTFGGLADVWMLTSWGDPNAPTPLLEGSTVTLAFGPDGMSGNGGCNNYRGDFQYDNGILVVQPLAATQMACDQPTTDQEVAFLSALQGASSYQLSGDTLAVFYDGGVLNFNRTAEAAEG
ncbi:MAG: META domain-containing protein, partial [Anaerolineae bacterium]|nr:META domain-containing protein [Anaerolineae bacterium]